MSIPYDCIHHDAIHRYFSFYKEPLFKKILKYQSGNLVDSKKWEALTHEEKLLCSIEEVYVVAAQYFWFHPVAEALEKSLNILKETFNEVLIPGYRAWLCENENAIASRLCPFRILRVKENIQYDCILWENGKYHLCYSLI